jgi:1-acyl-sn-glycerol-3-phosphate acyltransferase
MEAPSLDTVFTVTRRAGRAGLRTAAVLGESTATTAAYVTVAAASGFDLHVGARWTSRWAARLARRFGLRFDVRGQMPDYPALIVANHRSYVDIPAVGSLTAAHFIAKADIQRWPLLGLTFRVSPTLFVDRGNADRRRALRREVRRRFEQGVSIINFAEGTTTAGPGMLPFKMGLFKELHPMGIPVVPVTVTYTGMASRVEWIGNDTFLGHLLRLAGHDDLTAHLHILEPMHTGDHPTLAGFVGELRRRMLADLATREDLDLDADPQLEALGQAAGGQAAGDQAPGTGSAGATQG